MIGKLIPAGTGFEPGQFSDETPGEVLKSEALDGRMLDLFEDDIDVLDLIDYEEVEDIDDDLLDDEDIDEKDDLEDDFDEEDMELMD